MMIYNLDFCFESIPWTVIGLSSLRDVVGNCPSLLSEFLMGCWSWLVIALISSFSWLSVLLLSGFPSPSKGSNSSFLGLSKIS